MNYLPCTNPLILLLNNAIYTYRSRKMSLASRFSIQSTQSSFNQYKCRKILNLLIFGIFRSKIRDEPRNIQIRGDMK